ncbi:hypothetical protein [Roseburia sp. AM59-24XD]|uniref:hypothetical protein n=1 Tax=Roseburia sp. AM59-24XD TaxID=2293138 RepID=UPI000E4C8322|nr:hypothetical protein [Roseburia sp. AM59-24XD]RHP85318.1 hypothetical protein DXA20_09595 [Roseburia sp. AM59-24XD]
MRLIDADKLNFLEQHYNKSQMKAILDFLDAQPTAYDVDKVVKKLEERKSLYKRLQKLKDRDFIGYGYKIEAIDDAIEIVKENINHE